MRTYVRVTAEDGTKSWGVIDTRAGDSEDAIYLTTLTQVLQLSPGESPFFANYGVPYIQSILTQILPDLFISRTQQQFAQYFAALTVKRASAFPVPTYDISLTTKTGVVISMPVPT
jgi:hypothetical protein